MNLDNYINKYTNVSREELKKMSVIYFNGVIDSVFESIVRNLHNYREGEKKNGRADLRTRPLVQVLSVNVQPKNENKDSPLAIYGTIYAEIRDSGAMEVHELFNRERDVAEIVGTSNKLTLSGPEFSCRPSRTCTPLSWINVVLYDRDDNVFAKEHFCLDDAEFEDDYEEVKCKVIPCVQGSLTVQYILIPFGVNCRIEVQISNRQGSGNGFLNVNGKIAVRYANTYGNCVEEECVLFEKQGNDFELVEIGHGKSCLKLSRCWVALPAYSPLVVTLDLSEFGTSRKILNNIIELLPQPGGSGDSFVQEEMGLFIGVKAAWFQPQPFGRCYHSPSLLGIPAEDIEEMDTDEEDESPNEESDDDLSSNLKLPWSLHPHKNNLWPSPAVEIFSVFIGREKSKTVQIYGSIEVSIDDDEMCYIFKRDKEDALGLQEHVNTTPIPDGARLFENFSALRMKFDIKDVDGRLAIKGFVDWEARVLDSSSWHEKQLCSSIHGQNGFAAVHYSIFSHAVMANIKVYLTLKMGCGVYPKVCGSLVTQYSCYDYSTRYNKDYYRIVLFKRSHDDLVQLNSDWTIPLSRVMVVVPSYSSLIVMVDVSFGHSSGQMLSCARSMEIKISEGSKTIETTDFVLRMELDWCEIK